MSHETPAGLDEPLLQARQGPALDGDGQGESAQKIAQVLGKIASHGDSAEVRNAYGAIPPRMAASTERTVPSVKSFTLPETNYRQAMALADELGMRPLLPHCHLGLGKLYRRTGKRESTSPPRRECTARWTCRFTANEIEAHSSHLQHRAEDLGLAGAPFDQKASRCKGGKPVIPRRGAYAAVLRCKAGGIGRPQAPHELEGLLLDRIERSDHLGILHRSVTIEAANPDGVAVVLKISGHLVEHLGRGIRDHGVEVRYGGPGMIAVLQEAIAQKAARDDVDLIEIQEAGPRVGPQDSLADEDSKHPMRVLRAGEDLLPPGQLKQGEARNFH